MYNLLGVDNLRIVGISPQEVAGSLKLGWQGYKLAVLFQINPPVLADSKQLTVIL